MMKIAQLWLYAHYTYRIDCGTYLVQIFLFSKSSWRIWWFISISMCSWFNINLRVTWWFLATSSQKFATFSGYWAVYGYQLLGSSSWVSQPSLYLLNHMKPKDTCIRYIFIYIKSYKHAVYYCRCVPQVWNRTWMFTCCCRKTGLLWMK